MYFNTSVPDLIVDIRSSPRHDKSYNMVAYAIDRATDARINALPPIRRKATSDLQITAVQRQMIVAMVKKYRALHQQDGQPDIMEAIKDALETLMMDIATGTCLTSRWRASSTNENALIYFRRNTIKFLEPYLSGEREFLHSDNAAIEQAIATSSGKDITQSSIKRRVDEANIILARLEDIVPYIPTLRLECTFAVSGTSLPEHRKPSPTPFSVALFSSWRRTSPNTQPSCLELSTWYTAAAPGKLPLASPKT